MNGNNESTGGDRSSGGRRLGVAAALVAGGVAVGAVVGGLLPANAADTATSTTSTTSTTSPSAAPSAPADSRPDGPVDESKSQRPDEQLLTGDTASKVTAAALAKYPGATVLRVETDSDGIYEAHLTTSAGARVTVEVGKDFVVTGEEAAPAGGPPAHA